MASVLETFIILFKTNTDEVEKGAATAAETTDKLEASIKGADKSAVNMGKNFHKLATMAVAAFGSVFAVSKLMQGAVAQGANARELQILGGMLGDSTEELRAWGRAAVGSGVEIGSFYSSISGLNKSINEAFFGNPGEATRAFRILGVNVFDMEGKLKTVTAISFDLARAFGGLNRIGAQKIGGMFGLNDAFILMLMKGEDHVRKLVASQRDLSLVSQSQRARTAELSKQWALYGERISETGALIMANVDGPLTRLLEILNSVQDETDATLQGQSTLFEGLTRDINKAIERWEFFADIVKTLQNITAPVTEDGRGFWDIMTGNEAENRAMEKQRAKVLGGIAGGLDVADAFYKTDYGELTRALFESLPDLLGIRRYTDARARKIEEMNGRGGMTVHINGITIQTNATDSKGIAESISDELTRVMSDAIDSFDDGVGA